MEELCGEMWDFNSVGEKDKWIEICGIKLNLLEKDFIRVILEINEINWKVWLMK